MNDKTFCDKWAQVIILDMGVVQFEKCQTICNKLTESAKVKLKECKNRVTCIPLNWLKSKRDV